MSNDRVKLRPWDIGDLDQLVQYANNPNIASFLTNKFPHPYTREDGNSFIKMAQSHSPTRIFAIEYNRSMVGAIGLHPLDDIFSKNAELGYWVAQPYWGKGIATSAVSQIIEYGSKKLPITRIFARPFSNNKPSQRVLEKAGMGLEAVLKKTISKNGETLDECIYSILL